MQSYAPNRAPSNSNGNGNELLSSLGSSWLNGGNWESTENAGGASEVSGKAPEPEVWARQRLRTAYLKATEGQGLVLPKYVLDNAAYRRCKQATESLGNKLADWYATAEEYLLELHEIPWGGNEMHTGEGLRG